MQFSHFLPGQIGKQGHVRVLFFYDTHLEYI